MKYAGIILGICWEMIVWATALGVMFSVVGCGVLGAVFVPFAALDQDGETRFMETKEAELHTRLNPCLYDAVENDTGRILCKANDCACHERLVQRYLNRGHWVHGE
jgi:hypothetical protein